MAVDDHSANSSAKVGAIVYYIFASISTGVASKSLLTLERFNFPVAITAFQLLFTAPVCYFVARPELRADHAWAVLPMAVVNGVNVVTGLMGTGGLSMPMFIVLRRFTMAFTIGLEKVFYGRQHDWQVLAAVSIMVLGAVIAAVTDLSFNLYGYAAVLVNDVFTALYLVFLKHLPVARELSTPALLFYNSALSVLPLLALSWAVGDWRGMAAFPLRSNVGLQASLVATVVLGLTINHSTYLCTQLNEPLTTSVAGSMKNVIMTGIGAMAFGDYKFELWNCVGIVVSMAGAVAYAHHAAFSKKAAKVCKSPSREAVSECGSSDEEPHASLLSIKPRAELVANSQ